MCGSLSREENYSFLFLLLLKENSSTDTFFNKSLCWIQRLQSVTTAFYEKKKIHLRHKWLRGQHVQLIKVGKPCYFKMATINGGCLFCSRLTRKILQICLIQAVFSSFNVVKNVLNGLEIRWLNIQRWISWFLIALNLLFIELKISLRRF